MPAAHKPKDDTRAKLKALEFEKNGDPKVKPEKHTADVQFNPQTLSVRYQNYQTGTELPGSSGVQYVGRGSTSLSVDLLFDVTRPGEGGARPDDVRNQTKDVNWFMREFEKAKEGGEGEQYVPYGVRFEWGSFQFDGVMTSMDETLEFFDPQGHPLRATVRIGISKPGIYFPRDDGNGGIGLQAGVGVGASVGGSAGAEARPTGAENTSPTSVQQVAAQQGQQGNWKQVAAQSGVENPRAIHNPDALRT